MVAQAPRHRRLDLINSMPHGSQKSIAKIVGTSTSYVSAVLNGKKSQTGNTGTNIIRLAERFAHDAHRRGSDSKLQPVSYTYKNKRK